MQRSSLRGWMLVVAALSAAIGCRSPAQKSEKPGEQAQPAAPVITADGGVSVSIVVDDQGFHPSEVRLERGARATLIFTRMSDDTCATAVNFPELGQKKDLPLHQPVRVDVPTAEPRKLTFQCGMGMYKSSVLIQ